MRIGDSIFRLLKRPVCLPEMLFFCLNRSTCRFNVKASGKHLLISFFRIKSTHQPDEPELFSNRRKERRLARSVDRPLHDPDFLLREIAEVVDQAVDPAVGGIDLAL
jgi:hypothetical protein